MCLAIELEYGNSPFEGESERSEQGDDLLNIELDQILIFGF